MTGFSPIKSANKISIIQYPHGNQYIGHHFERYGKRAVGIYRFSFIGHKTNKSRKIKTIDKRFFRTDIQIHGVSIRHQQTRLAALCVGLRLYGR